MSYSLLACDLDGTLLNDNKEVSFGNKTAIEKASALGKTVIYATGRSLSEMVEYGDLLPVRYGILESSSLIYDFKEKKILRRETLDPEIILELLDIIEKEDVMITAFSSGKSYCGKDEMANMAKYCMGNYKDLYDKVSCGLDIRKFMKENKEDIEKILIYCQNTSQREEINKEVNKLKVKTAFAFTASLEISPFGLDKSDGLKYICDLLDIPVSETIAVGDGDNDKDLLNCAGLSIAVNNAVDSLKEIADIVIVNDNNHDAVKEVIEEYLI